MDNLVIARIITEEITDNNQAPEGAEMAYLQLATTCALVDIAESLRKLAEPRVVTKADLDSQLNRALLLLEPDPGPMVDGR